MKQSGFSLLELLIVVSIIGLLSVVAIPQYQKYKRKAMQTEAKTTLAILYTMQSSFIINHGYGTPNFSQIGFYPKGTYWYNTGWNGNDRYRGQNNINKTSESNLPNLSPEYEGPLAKTCQPTWTCNSVNIRGACDRVNRQQGKPCFLRTPSNGRIVALRTVDKSQIGEGTGTRDVVVDNNGYKDVEFIIGAINMYDDKWIITENQKLVNIP